MDIPADKQAGSGRRETMTNSQLEADSTADEQTDDQDAQVVPDEENDAVLTRRQLMTGAAVAGGASLAGCAGAFSTPEEQATDNATSVDFPPKPDEGDSNTDKIDYMVESIDAQNKLLESLANAESADAQSK